MTKFIDVTQIQDGIPPMPGIIMVDKIIGVMEISDFLTEKFSLPEGAKSAITLSRVDVSEEPIIYVAETLGVIKFKLGGV